MSIPPPLEFLLRCIKAAQRRYLRERLSTWRVSDASPPTVGVGTGAIRSALTELGIQPGDALMVHSNAAAIERLGLSLLDFSDLLQEHLGERGTLAVPTHPKLFNRDGRRVYDLRRSPSTVGLFTEIVRRRKEAIRSGYPFSAVAAIGAQAEPLTSEHRQSFAPHDERSPYAALADFGGKVLCLGVPITRMTIAHVGEDVLRDQLPIPDFYETGTVWVREGDEEREITTHRRAGWLWWYLSVCRWTRDMYCRQFVRELRLGGTMFRCAEALPVVNWMKSEVLAGRTTYPLAHLNRVLRLGTPPTADNSNL